MIPKIIFRYSWVYDNNYRNSPIIKKRLDGQNKNYPSMNKISNYIAKIEPIWRKKEKTILKTISEISGLKWTEKAVICYVIGFGRCFSDPLTVRLYENKDDFIDTLTHEMIHQMHIQNIKKSLKWKKYLQGKYNNESIITRNHIFLHSVHYHLYLKLFNKKRLNRDINFCKKVRVEDYVRSWQIVQKETPEAIIKKFKEVTK
jgi:hypothetical protein